MAIPRKTAYELSESQVTTPESVVDLFWKLAATKRKRLGSVIDFGAGDCRFAKNGIFERYMGIEIDPRRSVGVQLPENARLQFGCAFKHNASDYDEDHLGATHHAVRHGA